MTAYDVTVTREDNLWVADIAGLTAAIDVEHFTEPTLTWRCGI